MKKTYVTPETELDFMLTQDVITYSFEEQYNDVIDPFKNDLDDWNIKK